MLTSLLDWKEKEETWHLLKRIWRLFLSWWSQWRFSCRHNRDQCLQWACWPTPEETDHTAEEGHCLQKITRGQECFKQISRTKLAPPFRWFKTLKHLNTSKEEGITREFFIMGKFKDMLTLGNKIHISLRQNMWTMTIFQLLSCMGLHSVNYLFNR